MRGPCRYGHPPMEPLRGRFRGKIRNYWHCPRCKRDFDRKQTGRVPRIPKTTG